MVECQLQRTLNEVDYLDPFYSWFGLGFGTETALITLLDGRSGIGSIVTFLALLHLSAAFDTIDHDTLLDWLQDLGMDGTVL